MNIATSARRREAGRSCVGLTCDLARLGTLALSISRGIRCKGGSSLTAPAPRAVAGTRDDASAVRETLRAGRLTPELRFLRATDEIACEDLPENVRGACHRVRANVGLLPGDLIEQRIDGPAHHI